MREFVPAGGELMIHAALHPKHTPTPEVILSLGFVEALFRIHPLYLGPVTDDRFYNQGIVGRTPLNMPPGRAFFRHAQSHCHDLIP